jgi:hypothetical protein
MKKIILSIVGVLAVLWVALFVSGQQVLVWERAVIGKQVENLFDCFDKDYVPSDANTVGGSLDGPKFCRERWACTYFNGRKLIVHSYPTDLTACPNFRKNR